MVSRTLITGILAAAACFAQTSYFPTSSYFREAYKRPVSKVELQPPQQLANFLKQGADCARDIVSESAEKSAAEAPKLEGIDVSLSDAPVVVTSGAATASRCLVLSLQNYLALVMANHTTVQTSILSVETSKNSLTIAQAKFDPSINLTFKPFVANGYNTFSQGRYAERNYDFGSVSLNQTLPTGQILSFTGNGARDVTSGLPSASSGLNFGVTQHLLKDRGSYITRTSLMRAQSTLKTSRLGFTSSLISLVNSAESAYWNLLSAKQSLYVARKNLGIQTAYMDYVNQQLDLGAISRLEIFNPQQQVESARVTVTNQEFSVRNAEDAIRRQIGADLDPTLRDVAIVVVDLPDLSAPESIVPDRELTVQKAYTQSPSLLSRIEQLDALQYSVADSRNALLPTLDLSFNTNVLGLNRNQGLAGYMGEMFGWTNSKYTWSLNFTFPVRNRVNTANLANTLINRQSQMLSLRGAQQDLRQSVLQAVNNFENALRSLDLTKKNRETAQLNYQAQLARYKLGINQQIDVLQGSSTLSSADQSVVNAQISLRTSLLNLWVQTGELLDRRNIVVNVP
jgi:outer membrane protein TolC